MSTELPAESENDGKTHRLPDGSFSVKCKWCKETKTQQIMPDLASMLRECKWQLSIPGKTSRKWSCTKCAKWSEKKTTPTATDTTPKTTDAAGSAGGTAGQLAAATTALSFDDLNSEVEQLKAEVEELKAEVGKWSPGVLWHVKMKEAHVVEIRRLRQYIEKLRAEVIAAQHPPPASPP